MAARDLDESTSLEGLSRRLTPLPARPSAPPSTSPGGTKKWPPARRRRSGLSGVLRAWDSMQRDPEAEPDSSIADSARAAAERDET